MKEAIAVWWDTTSTTTELDIDLNIWLTKKKYYIKRSIRWIYRLFNRDCCTGSIRDSYIEFGLRIINFQNINKIFIYLPFNFTKYDIRDMVPDLKESDLANALFNEKMSVVTDHSTLYEVSYVSGGKSPFYASRSALSDQSIIPTEDGCILTLDIPANIGSDGFSDILYKRIRVNKIETIVNEFAENNFLIDGFFKKLQTVDVSINTTRKLPATIVDKLIQKINIKSINFFLMTNIFSDIIFKSEDIKNSRILEQDIWNNYLGIDKKSGKEIKKIIAYQWKAIPKDMKYIQDYNLFVKFAMIRKQGLIFALSILAIIGMGVISGYGGNRFTSYMDRNSTDTNQTQEGGLSATDSKK